MYPLCLAFSPLTDTNDIDIFASSNGRINVQAASFTALEYLEHCSRTVCNGVHTLF